MYSGIFSPVRNCTTSEENVLQLKSNRWYFSALNQNEIIRKNDPKIVKVLIKCLLVNVRRSHTQGLQRLAMYGTPLTN